MNEVPNEPECCPPDCCDMRGFLTFQIMWELRNEKLNGQQIADRIWKRRGGNRPTPGTIYPALKDLKERRLIHGEKEGNQIIYHLTSEGVKGLEEAARYFYQAFGDIVEESKEIVVRIGDCDC
ncbi:MAG: PadR family transcriptional regulator [Candidatus Thorarchaeota archaeon]